MSPPRLHVIPAIACDLALLLRRGPSGHVASILWNRSDDSFQTGQWLTGRIYEHRADLSPDGRHIVYFAGTGQRWWTAVSRAPWLRALAFFPQDSTWLGGGAFDAAGRLWLNGGDAGHDTLPDDLCAAPAEAFPSATDGFHMGGLFAAMMALRGWQHLSGERYDVRMTKPLADGWSLELGFQLGAGNRSMISPRYVMVNEVAGLRVEHPDWEWAEPRGSQINFAARGCLWKVFPGPDGHCAHPDCIKDFSDMTPEHLDAPYAGIREPSDR